MESTEVGIKQLEEIVKSSKLKYDDYAYVLCILIYDHAYKKFKVS